MKKLHWEAVDNGVMSKDSIWAQLNPDQADIDFGEFESKFSATAAKPVAAKAAGGGAKPKFVALLDPRRQQAIEIGLSRFGMNHGDIVTAIVGHGHARS